VQERVHAGRQPLGVPRVPDPLELQGLDEPSCRTHTDADARTFKHPDRSSYANSNGHAERGADAFADAHADGHAVDDSDGGDRADPLADAGGRRHVPQPELRLPAVRQVVVQNWIVVRALVSEK